MPEGPSFPVCSTFVQELFQAQYRYEQMECSFLFCLLQVWVILTGVSHVFVFEGLRWHVPIVRNKATLLTLSSAFPCQFLCHIPGKDRLRKTRLHFDGVRLLLEVPIRSSHLVRQIRRLVKSWSQSLSTPHRSQFPGKQVHRAGRRCGWLGDRPQIALGWE